MKRAPRSRQRHDLYAKYHDYDSEISDLLGECGLKELLVQRTEPELDRIQKMLEAVFPVKNDGTNG